MLWYCWTTKPQHLKEAKSTKGGESTAAENPTEPKSSIGGGFGGGGGLREAWSELGKSPGGSKYATSAGGGGAHGGGGDSKVGDKPPLLTAASSGLTSGSG